MKPVLTANYKIAARFIYGKITLHDAARELCKLGWTNYVDEHRTLVVIENTIKDATRNGIDLKSTLTSR